MINCNNFSCAVCGAKKQCKRTFTLVRAVAWSTRSCKDSTALFSRTAKRYTEAATFPASHFWTDRKCVFFYSWHLLFDSEVVFSLPFSYSLFLLRLSLSSSVAHFIYSHTPFLQLLITTGVRENLDHAGRARGAGAPRRDSVRIRPHLRTHWVQTHHQVPHAGLLPRNLQRTSTNCCSSAHRLHADLIEKKKKRIPPIRCVWFLPLTSSAL